MKPSPTALLRASALALLGLAPLSAFACNDEPYIGSVCTVAFDWCPNGYLPADGRQVAVRQYTALFGTIGFNYGGDGQNNFNLPDLRGRSVIGTGTSDYGTSTTIARKGGAASATLTANNVPAHLHPATANVPAGSLTGQVSVPVTGGTVSGQSIAGSVTVNALNSATNSPANAPSATYNTIGKIGTGQLAYYQAPAAGSNTGIGVPTSHNLTVSGGSIADATATGPVALPSATTQLFVTVGPNNPSAPTPVPTMSPNLGMTVCIAVQGLYPSRP